MQWTRRYHDCRKLSGQIFQNNNAIHWMKDIWKWWGAPRTHITLGVAEWSNNFLGLPTPWRLLVQRIETPFQRHQQPQNVRSFLTCKQIEKITFKGWWVAQKALRWNVVLFLFDAVLFSSALLSSFLYKSQVKQACFNLYGCEWLNESWKDDTMKPNWGPNIS